MRWTSRITALLAAGALATTVSGLSARPAQAAQVVSGSTSWGSFRCTGVKVWGGGGTSRGYFTGQCTVTDKAKDGRGVYLAYNGVRNKMWDTGWHRFGRNASGKGRSLTQTVRISANEVDYWRLRVCKQVADAKDPCSSHDVAS